MTDVTRRSLLAATGVALTAGCLTDSGDGPGGGGTTTTAPGKTPRTESRERETTDSGGETTTGDWIEHASNQPNPDHEITLENESDAAEAVRIRVERDATGETVFESTETVDAGVDISVWNLKKASPDGVEAFTVCAELVESDTSTVGSRTTTTDSKETITDSEETTTDSEETTTDSERRDCAPLHTNECYGNAYVTVREDGSLQIIYTIC
ncbi:hypothetical protein [Halorussus litoreus]|uniref:hypothetical protein n=1 Tax=Halorussus litoreus TaxID=1710536 RepID=UPI000E268EF0|nr:hypothetical protein [Halorussus litoreus]